VQPGDGQRIAAGVVASLVGFAGAFTVVLAGLRAVGATDDQATSGLLAVSVAMGLATAALSLRTRMPVAIAWSTPGAALLIATGPVEGGFAAAVGAFVVAGALTVLAGLSRALADAIGRIPVPVASAMLAGVLLPLCLEPARAVVAVPELAGPVVAAYLVLGRLAPRWAVLGALVVAAVAAAADGARVAAGDLAPRVELVAPAFEPAVALSLGVPLFLVTMASQNIPGAGVLASFGFRPRLGPIFLATGAGSVAAAPAGGHGINLAAITAALMAGPAAGEDPSRRWVAAVAAGVTSVVVGLAAGALTAAFLATPPELVACVAGVALLGPLAGALRAALDDDAARDAAVVTLVTTASGIVVAGVTAPFWGLVAGLAVLALRRA
jgi:benzoate membrane transport protein